VIWHLHPRIRVGFDGRYRTVYPADVERKFLDFQTLKPNDSDITPMLDDFDTGIVLLPNDRGPLEYMEQRSDWQLVYRDGQASVFLRDVPEHQNLIGEFGRHPASEKEPVTWTEFPAGPGHGIRSLSFSRAEVVADKRASYDLPSEQIKNNQPSES